MPTAGVRGSRPSPPNTKPSAKSRWVLWGPQVGLLRKRPGAWGHRSRHPISAGLFLPLHASRACPPRIQGPGGETHMPGVTSLCARAVPPPFLAHLLVSAPALSSPVTPTCPHPSSHQNPAGLGTTASSLWLHPRMVTSVHSHAGSHTHSHLCPHSPHTHTCVHAPTLAHTRTLTLRFTLPLMYIHSLPYTRLYTYPHTHSHFLTRLLSLILSHSYLLTHMLTLSFTRGHVLAQSHTHAHPQAHAARVSAPPPTLHHPDPSTQSGSG